MSHTLRARRKQNMAGKAARFQFGNQSRMLLRQVQSALERVFSQAHPGDHLSVTGKAANPLGDYHARYRSRVREDFYSGLRKLHVEKCISFGNPMQTWVAEECHVLDEEGGAE